MTQLQHDSDSADIWWTHQEFIASKRFFIQPCLYLARFSSPIKLIVESAVQWIGSREEDTSLPMRRWLTTTTLSPRAWNHRSIRPPRTNRIMLSYYAAHCGNNAARWFSSLPQGEMSVGWKKKPLATVCLPKGGQGTRQAGATFPLC